MRLRNVKNASAIVAKHPLVVSHNVFDNSKPLHIEIGMGKGDFIINMALIHPDINFIGIEKYESVLVKALSKVDENIPNLRFMSVDASTLGDTFNKNVDLIYLNFSDPWPKKRHYKRRLTSPGFLSIYEKISKNDVYIKMKTDNKGLFAYSLKEFNNNGYTFNEVSLDLEEKIDGYAQTEYEKKFRQKGETINYIYVTKKMQ